MAFDFSKLNFFSRLNARTRLFVLLAGVVGLVSLVYLGTRWIFGGGETVGPSKVATAPAGLQSVPGGKGMTAQYYQALQQAGVQSAQQAKMTGQSAVPTLVNLGEQSSSSQCNIICYDKLANVKSLLDDWTRQGKLDRDIADQLQKLADKNVSADEYAAFLDQLVHDGKLTPEQARELLEQYKKQHANALLQDSARFMDDLIKAGQLPLDAANELLTAQKNGIHPADYAAMLQRMVKEGKLSPDTAQRLLSQYIQQYAKEVTMQSIAILQGMLKSGELTAEVEKDLVNLENQMVPLDVLDQLLKRYVTQGKLTPVVSNKVLDEYKRQKAAIGPGESLNDLIKNAEASAYQELNDLLKAGKITQDTAAQIADMIQKNVSLGVFNAAIDQLVVQKKLTPDIAKLKKADYAAIKELRDLSDHLANLNANNATSAQYAEELKRAVQAGILTPDQAAQLLQDYQSMATKGLPIITSTAGVIPEFAALQQRVQAGAVTVGPAPTAQQFQVAQVQTLQETDQQKQERFASLAQSMSAQSQQLIGAWQPENMLHRQAAGTEGEECKPSETGTACQSKTETGRASAMVTRRGASLIKAGTVLFGVLDTAINSDYPDTPVMVTIVEGMYKGAKLLGKLATTKSVSGQLDRVSLNFNLMNLDAWEKAKTITAFAIDPDTARTVLASTVNYHYMLRFGAMFATSFLQGYASAITTSGSTSTTGIFGTSTSYPKLSPGQKLFAALGQVGQTVGQATQNYVNTPPTVRVDSGVSLGILFMTDVTDDVT